ncbi:hypothetical protein BYT27DRAFT_7209061 [Phlegmacium glaucopus]|nr:hypothetical protein BYT27DRAFT_7209061 [Phlegmacium glaucopus]
MTFGLTIKERYLSELRSSFLQGRPSAYRHLAFHRIRPRGGTQGHAAPVNSLVTSAVSENALANLWASYSSLPEIPCTIEIAEDEPLPFTVATETVPPSTRALPDPPEDQALRDLSPLTALGSSDPPDDAYACAPGTPEPYQSPNIDPPSFGASDRANADVIDTPRSSQASPSRLTIRIPPRVPVEHDYTTLVGCPFLPQTPSVVWPGGTVKTNLPWLPHPDNPEENLMAKDEKHVRGLAETGRPASESDWISIVRYEDYADEFALGQHIREQIAQSHAVVVRGCPYRPIPLDAQQIWKGMRIPPGQTLNVHVPDGAKRVEDVAMPFKFMTLEDFCEGQRDPNKIQCVLHCPTVDGSRPELIRQVDEGHTAWYQLQHPFHRVRESIPLDVQSSSSWLLFHQALWHTYAHHDAEGYGTWSQVLHGLKIWVLMRSPRHDRFKSRKDIYEASNKLHNDAFTGDGEYSKNSERFVIYATPGDLIFQYPGCKHEVYTPVPSVVLGGHFYTYNSLHLTELWRAIDKRTNSRFTNQTHPNSTLTIMMMMAALPILQESHLRRKSLAALCRMVLHVSDYSGPIADRDLVIYNSKRPKKYKVKEMPDVEYAKQLAKKLQTKMALKLDVCHSLQSSSGPEDFLFTPPGWVHPGDLIRWKEEFNVPYPV